MVLRDGSDPVACIWQTGKESGRDGCSTRILKSYSVIACIQLLDVQPPGFSLTEEFLENLRLSLVSERRLYILVTISYASIADARSINPDLVFKGYLQAIAPDDVETQSRIKNGLANTFRSDRNVDSARQQLERVQKKPLS